MKKSSWIRGAAAVLGLALGGALYGQSSTIQEPSSLYKTSDGILVTDYFKQLPRDKDINVDSLISGGNVTNLTALDPIFVIKNKIDYLKNDPRAKSFYASKKDVATNTYTDEARLRMISIYEQLLTKVENEKRTPDYYKSLDKLARSINSKDHVITTKELEGVLGGFTYVIDKMGKVGNKTYDAPMLVYFENEKPKATIETIVQKSAEQPKQNLPTLQVPQDEPKPQIPADSPKPQIQTPIVQENKKSDLEFFIDASASPNLIGGRIGIDGRITPWAEFGVSLNGAYGFPDTVSSTQTQPSPTGRYFVGSITNENQLKIGADVEFTVGDKNGGIFIGGGPSLWIYGQKTSEQLLDSSNNVVESNINEQLKLTPSLEAYLGYKIKWFRFLVGYDSFKQFYAETGISFPIATSNK